MRVSWKAWSAVLALVMLGGILITIGVVLYPASAMNDFGGHMPTTEAEIVPGLMIGGGALLLAIGAMRGMNRMINGLRRARRSP